jgi:hypothetical protein
VNLKNQNHRIGSHFFPAMARTKQRSTMVRGGRKRSVDAVHERVNKKKADEGRVVYKSKFGICYRCGCSLQKWGKPQGYTNGFYGGGTNGECCPVPCERVEKKVNM